MYFIRYLFILPFLFLFSCKSVFNNNLFNNNDKKCTNFAVIISGPSGVGKTVLSEKLKQNNNNLDISISMTTRSPRAQELDGADYYFVSIKEFEQKVKDGHMLEYVKYLDNYYGMPLLNYNNAIKNNHNIIFNMTTEGMRSIKANKNIKSVSIFIAPPSIEVLEQRLRNRKTDSNDQINKRLTAATTEMNNAYEYDYIVYNCDIEHTVKVLQAIYDSIKMQNKCI